MNWFDPKNWDDEKTNGIDQITALISHFKVSLKAAGFNSKAVFKEWRFFENYVRANNIDLESLQLWKKIFNNKKEEYSNLCKLMRIVLSLSSSNSSAERAFSLLPLLLSNRRLCMNYDTLQNLMLININNKLWTSKEKKGIIENACQMFLSLRRTKRAAKPPAKAPRIEADVVIEHDSSESSDIDSSSEDTESNSETDKENNTDTD